MNQSNTNIFILKLATKDIYFKIGDELREFNDVSIQPKPTIWRTSESLTGGGTSTGPQQQQQHWQQNDGQGRSAKSPDFFQDIMLLKEQKQQKKYTNTRVKSRNFLSNIS